MKRDSLHNYGTQRRATAIVVHVYRNFAPRTFLLRLFAATGILSTKSEYFPAPTRRPRKHRLLLSIAKVGLWIGD